MPDDDPIVFTFYARDVDLDTEHWLTVAVDRQLEQLTSEQRSRLIAWWTSKWGPS